MREKEIRTSMSWSYRNDLDKSFKRIDLRNNKNEMVWCRDEEESEMVNSLVEESNSILQK
jgi:hypothetical protein